MMKTLRLSLMLLLTVIGLNAYAGKIVFGELGLENSVAYTEPFDGGDFTVTFGGGGNNGKYYTTGSGIRVYGGGTMTIAAKSGTLTKIVITYDGTNKPESADVVNTGTYDPTTGTWTGDAAEVVFTRPSGSGHWRVQSIATGNDAVGPEVPTEGQTPEEAITVARALEIINAMADGASTSFTYYVKGCVTSVKSITKTNAQFYIGDQSDSQDVIQTYNTKGLGNKEIINLEFVEDGDEVVVYGVLQKYKNNTTQEIVPEISGGYVYSVNGNTEDDTPNPEDAIQGGTQESPLTVEQAINYINGFPDGFTTAKQYYVSGTVASISEISTANGNATFVMDGLTVYRVKGLENKDIKDEAYLKVNDAVIVLAKLQKYVKDNTVTPEMSSGYIYSLNGKTQEDVPPVVLVGDGSKTNPYLVSDLRQMTEEIYPAEDVWVKGVIIGSASSATALKAEGEDVNSNIAIAVTATDTEFSPVALAINTIFRTKLNVVDNPENKGKEVLLCGKIQKYFGTAGVKELVEAVLDGTTIAEAIKGDVNGDGEVGIGDIITVTNVMAGDGTEEQIKRADVNGDNEVGIGDIISITNIMAGE